MSQERLEAVRSALGDLDALLVSSPVNVRWLTGVLASRCALLIAADHTVLCTDERYLEAVSEEVRHIEVVADRSDGWLVQRCPGGSRLGVEDHVVSWAQVEALRRDLAGVDLVPAGRRVEPYRMVKDADEQALLTQACSITALALIETFETLRPGMSEREVANAVEDALRRHGADDRGFETIVASGPNGSRPHHRAGQRLLATGELVTIDAGALVGGYHADMTRTVSLGEPETRLADVYQAVREAQAAGIANLVAGRAAGEIDECTREVLSKAGLGDSIRHATGHGVGLELHEAPILRSGQTATLPAGAVVTVEPGAYLPGVGGVRIEDTVVVTESGSHVLTAATTELLTL